MRSSARVCWRNSRTTVRISSNVQQRSWRRGVMLTVAVSQHLVVRPGNARAVSIAAATTVRSPRGLYCQACSQWPLHGQPGGSGTATQGVHDAEPVLGRVQVDWRQPEDRHRPGGRDAEQTEQAQPAVVVALLPGPGDEGPGRLRGGRAGGSGVIVRLRCLESGRRVFARSRQTSRTACRMGPPRFVIDPDAITVEEVAGGPDCQRR